EALACAHQQDLLHGNLQPSSLLVGDKDVLHVMDFGLAGWAAPDQSQLMSEATLPSLSVYAAPEWYLADPTLIGPQTDLYSAGAILYQLLTGRLPIDGPPVAILNKPPVPPSRYRADLDGRLEALCLEALAKKPDQRMRSAQEFA